VAILIYWVHNFPAGAYQIGGISFVFSEMLVVYIVFVSYRNEAVRQVPNYPVCLPRGRRGIPVKNRLTISLLIRRNLCLARGSP